MVKQIPLEKARAIVKALPENNYAIGATLEKVGYATTTANANGGKIVNNALKIVMEADRDEIMASDKPLSIILQRARMSPDDVINEYSFIVKQNKDLTNKLKALMPLLKELGITWEDKATIVNPTLNLTVKQNENTGLNRATEITSHKDHYATLEDTAQPSDIIQNDDNMASLSHISAGGFDSSAQDRKEGESTISNISENSTLDNVPDLSQNTEATVQNISENSVIDNNEEIL